MQKCIRSLLVWAMIALTSACAGHLPPMPQQMTQPATAQNGKTVLFQCEQGKSITATFFPHHDVNVKLSLSDGRELSLPHAISADGARYASASGHVVFWTKGNTAFITREGKQTFSGCVRVAADPGGTLPHSYTHPKTNGGFSIRYPDGFKPDAKYIYQALGPGRGINGVKFTIPPDISAGTNLAADTYVSVETLPNPGGQNCGAERFLETGAMTEPATSRTSAGVTYSVASATGAGAGNRYEETVYARPYTRPCIAVRYFIHYNVLQNYPAGKVRQFDEATLKHRFDAIRDSLVIAQ